MNHISDLLLPVVGILIGFTVSRLERTRPKLALALFAGFVLLLLVYMVWGAWPFLMELLYAPAQAG